MPADTRVKICGLTRPQDVDALVQSRAAYGGLVFLPKSPRAIGIAQARALAQAFPPDLASVGLFVDPDDALLDAVLAEVPLSILQLHGKETPERVSELRARHGLPVMKAVGVASADDLPALADYGRVADMLLVDAKAPKDAVLPGGNGLAFDWRLIAGRRWPVPWMLAGGLTPANVRDAIALTGARQVDVSSGVESAPGVKDGDLIAAFCAAAHA